MTKKKDIIIIYFFILIEFLILSNSKIVINNIKQSSYLFISNIFPSMFPTMVVGLMLTKLNFYKILPKFINRIFKKLFNFNNVHTAIFLSSFICGAPNNAVFINEYLNKGLISEKEAESLLCSTHFINPLFIIYVVGVGIFNNVKVGILIILIMLISNFIKLRILKNDFNSADIYLKNDSFCGLNTFFTTIKTTINSILNIFAVVVIFNILIALISNIFNFNYLLNTLINLSLETTNGINKISTLKISDTFKFLLAYFGLSFGGLCICLQTLLMIENKKIKHLKYFIFRLF